MEATPSFARCAVWNSLREEQVANLSVRLQCKGAPLSSLDERAVYAVSIDVVDRLAHGLPWSGRSNLGDRRRRGLSGKRAICRQHLTNNLWYAYLVLEVSIEVVRFARGIVTGRRRRPSPTSTEGRLRAAAKPLPSGRIEPGPAQPGAPISGRFASLTVRPVCRSNRRSDAASCDEPPALIDIQSLRAQGDRHAESPARLTGPGSGGRRPIRRSSCSILGRRRG